jgi:hypothetical protein
MTPFFKCLGYAKVGNQPFRVPLAIHNLS